MTTVVISENSSADFAGVEDCHILQSSNSYFNNTTLEVRTDGTQDRRTLIRFGGLSNITSGNTVTAAFIRFTAQSTAVRTWTAYKCTRAWTDPPATGTGAGVPNWNDYATGQSWATAGGRGTGDSDATASGSGASPGTAGVTFDVTLDSTGIAAVQSWIDGGSVNNGFIILSSGSGTNTASSSEGTDGARPELHVTYTPAAYSLTVDSADATGEGQSVAMPIAMPVTAGQATLNPYDVPLLFTAAYVLTLTHGQATMEGQEIPFILTHPYTDAEIAAEGQSVTLLSELLISVDAGEATGEGQSISPALAILIDSADASGEGSLITLTGIGVDPPALGTAIPNISAGFDTGTHQYDLSAYFVGSGLTYAIDPAVEIGWTFDTGTALLEIDTDDASSFGPYTVTASNGNGSVDSNAFFVYVTTLRGQPRLSFGFSLGVT